LLFTKNLGHFETLFFLSRRARESFIGRKTWANFILAKNVFEWKRVRRRRNVSASYFLDSSNCIENYGEFR
jgi:hypothetical protein